MSSYNFSGMRQMIGIPDLAIDLGTANARLSARGCGLIANEPSLVKVSPLTEMVEAVGVQAARLANLDAGSVCFSPLHAGVVTDVKAATALLKPFFRRASRLGLRRPRALACAPPDACPDERAALVEAIQEAGAASVVVVPEPLAAAIGAGLDVASPYAQLLIDIGDGVTDIVVIRSGEIINTYAIRTACGDLHRAVSQTVASNYGVLLFPQEAARLTHAVGAFHDTDEETVFISAGTDLLSGRPVSLYVSSYDITYAVEPVLEVIVSYIRNTISALPDDISCEIIESDVCLTGGGAQIQGLAERLAAESLLTVKAAENPVYAAINGAEKMLAVGMTTNLWVEQSLT